MFLFLKKNAVIPSGARNLPVKSRFLFQCRIFFNFTFIILYPAFSFAQPQKISGEHSRTIDSLKTELAKANSPSLREGAGGWAADTAKVNLLNALAWELVYQNPDTAIILSNQALALCTDALNASPRFKANTLNQLGWFKYLKGDYSLSLEYNRKALEIWKTLFPPSGGQMGASTLGRIGIVYMDQGDYPKALDYYFKALKMDEDLGDKNGIAAYLGYIGSVYKQQADYPKALEYYFKALKVSEELENKNYIASWLGNIGNVYNEQAEAHPNPSSATGGQARGELFNKALDYYFKALKIGEELGDKNRIAIQLGNIGVAYDVQGDYHKALDYYFKALKIREELGVKKLIATTLGNIGSLYTSLQKYEEAYQYLYRALALSDSIGAMDHVKSWYESLSELYEKANISLPDSCRSCSDSDSSFALGESSKVNLLNMEQMRLRSMYYYKRYIFYRDAIFSEENKKQIIRKEMQYEFEKAQIIKEQEKKERQRQEAAAVSRRNLLQYSGILIFLVVLFVSLAAVIPGLRGISRLIPLRFLEGGIFFTFLLFFEFLLVLADPYIEQWTGGAPMWKLVFNAGIAALIFPLHAYFERVLKRRLITTSVIR